MRSILRALSVLSLLVFLPVVSYLGTATGQRAETAPSVNQTKAAKPGAARSADNSGKPDDYREDFAVLPLEKNRLKTEIEILGEKDDKPGMPFIRERWHLMWRPGDPIDVFIVRPRDIERPPVVLYLYSFPQDTDRFKQDYWCGQTTAGGFAAVGFVSALTGQRVEQRSLKEDFFNQLPESMGATAHDVQMILNYLASRGDLDMSRVGMLGQGSGGSIAILASAVDPRIKALDLLTPWGNWPLFLEKSTFVPSEDRLELNKPEFLAKVAPVDPLQWLPAVKAQSVRIQDVRSDGHMPDEAQEAMEAAAPPAAEIDQFGDGAALVPAAANGRLLEWIKGRLQPDAKPQVAADRSQRVHFHPAKGETNPLGEAR